MMPIENRYLFQSSNAELLRALQKTLDGKYATIVGSARAAWEKQFAGHIDPSDACVTVRIAPRNSISRSLPA